MARIIGGGLLATAFRFSQIDNTLIFCSGVSDSRGLSAQDCLREERLLLSELRMVDDGVVVIYFSSLRVECSCSAYVRHKLKMEQILIDSECEVLIIRLPQVVGVPCKRHQLIPSMVSAAVKGEEYVLQSGVRRNLIGVSDLTAFVRMCVEKQKRGMQRFVASYSPTVDEIAMEIDTVLAIYGLWVFANSKESSFHSDPNNFKARLGCERLSSGDYYKTVLAKYVPKIAEHLGG